MNIFLASLMSFLLSISLTGCGEMPVQPPELLPKLFSQPKPHRAPQKLRRITP